MRLHGQDGRHLRHKCTIRPIGCLTLMFFLSWFSVLFCKKSAVCFCLQFLTKLQQREAGKKRRNQAYQADFKISFQ